ncbi:hypothetical protein AURDEDRAFT_118417 [Auricularia subglabra TFB-10046 SS5]|nr:hypothetical protein AURDEDRAFT_118417 [Auricularia subglabra TFB-10046 SS5]
MSESHPKVGGKTLDFTSYAIPAGLQACAEDANSTAVPPKSGTEVDSSQAPPSANNDKEDGSQDEDQDDDDSDEDDDSDSDDDDNDDGKNATVKRRGPRVSPRAEPQCHPANPDVSQANMEDALKKVDFQGSFYFSRTYGDAPNPVLRLTDLGTIGLPLGIRDAAAIIENSELAPFGKGERTVVDKEVRDTWQMDSGKVTFDNPAWATFMDLVVQEVCQGLGVNVNASQPRCELHKLLLYETGSHFLAHVDTEKANNMFATIVVVLPTVFMGGDAHLTHGGRSVVLNSSAFSLSKTTVLAWYTDVKHEIKPITSGYRLALSFNLVHTTTALRPSIADDAAPLLHLRDVMRAWRDERRGVDRILYKLDHTYSHANLSASALKGPDAHVLAILDEAAKELGFCLGLGTLEHTVSGYADDDYGGYDGDIEVSSTSTSLDKLFDLDGRVIAQNGYQGNEAGEVSRCAVYRRTVLLIWPTWGGPCRDGDRRAAYALERLSLAGGTSPTAEEEEFFTVVHDSGQTDKLHILCKVAQRWHRGDLWQSVILTLGGEKKPAHERFAPISSCGFEPSRSRHALLGHGGHMLTVSSIERFIQQSTSNFERFEMLNTLESWAKEQPTGPLQQLVSSFARGQESWLLHNLCAPKDNETKVDYCASFSLTEFVPSVVPQIKIKTASGYCFAYAHFLHKNAQRLATNPDDSDVLKRIINDLLSAVVERIDYFPATGKAKTPYPSYGQPAKPKPAPEVAFKVITRCLDYGQPALAARAIERMLEVKELSTDVGSRALSVLLPLIPLVDNDLKARSPRPDIPLGKLAEAAIRFTLESDLARKGQLTTEDVDALLSASLLGGETELFTSLFIPKLTSLPWSERSWKTYINLLHKHRTEPVFAAVSSQLDDAVTAMVTAYARNIVLPTLPAPAVPAYLHRGSRGRYGVGGRAITNCTICETLSVCLKARGMTCMKLILDRVVDDKLLRSTQYISGVLIPFVEQLSPFATQHGLVLSSEPFAYAIQKIMRSWIDLVLGAMPDHTRARPLLNSLARYSCTCAESSTNRELLLDRIGAPKRKHVEQELSRWARGAATYEFIKTTPQGLKVTKAEVLVAPGRWKRDQTIGQQALNALGNSTDLRTILGGQHAYIVGQLNGTEVAAVPPPRPPKVAPAAASSASLPVISSANVCLDFADVDYRRPRHHLGLYIVHPMAEPCPISSSVSDGSAATGSQARSSTGGKTVFYAMPDHAGNDSDVDSSQPSQVPEASLAHPSRGGKTVDFASYAMPGDVQGDADRQGPSSTPSVPAEAPSEPPPTHPSEEGNDEEDEEEDEDGDEEDHEDEGDEEDREDEDDEDEDEDEEMDDGSSSVGDIRDDLQDALENVDFHGSFYFSRTYDDAPNPILRLRDLGTVGLPLSVREAAAIIEKSEQAPFGKGERTLVDKEVRDTWQMDADKVTFDNPAWTPFLDRVVQDVCQALGVNREASRPRCDLHKLLLYETGSHFLAHVDTEKANNMFATIVVVLPTVFTGGDAHLSHGGRSVVLNSSAFSLSKTTVLAWYTDVKHEIKPITSGYRLALSFNLVHTTTALRPSIANDAAPLLRLRHVLRAWRDDEGDVDRIVYQLDHTYSHANLSGSALKGPDAHVLAIVDEAAKELGFCLGLGTLKHTIRGYAENDYDNFYGRRYGVEMGEVTDTSTSIDTLFDLEGRIIARNVRLDEDTATIPEDFLTAMQDEQCDHEDYEGYQGNAPPWEANSQQVYRRTVLVIWPTWGGPCRGGDRRAVYALERLALAAGPTPVADEEDLFAFVYQSRQADKLPLLSKLAQQWHRGDLWQSVILTLGVDGKPAHERFAPIAACGIEAYICMSTSNSKRFEMLTSLESWANAQEPGPLQQDVVYFVRMHTPWLLHNLCTPTDLEKKFITDAATLHGGVSFLETIIIPQIMAKSNASYCYAYAQFLHDEQQRIALSAEDSVVVARIIADLLSYVVEKMRFFDSTPQAEAGYPAYGHVAKPKPAPNSTYKIIKRCLDYGYLTLAARVIDRLTDAKGWTATVSGQRAFAVLLPLIPLLDADLKARTPRPELPLVELVNTAIRLTFDSEFAQKGQLVTADIDALLIASLLGDPGLFDSLFIPKLTALPWNATSWKACIELLHKRRTEPAFAVVSTQLGNAVTAMVRTYAQKVDLPASSAQAYNYSSKPRYGAGGRLIGDTRICDVLTTCVKVDGMECAKIVLDRVLHGAHSTQYISDVLIPLIEQLAAFAREHRLSLSGEPFASAIRQIMSVWLDKVLGAMPDESLSRSLLNTLARYTCTCEECKSVRTFLTTIPERVLTLDRIGAPKRKHVEQQLSSWARGAATYDFIRTTPQGLKVTKAEVMVAPVRWKSEQIVGLRALKALGNEGKLRAIFGDQYTSIVGRLTGIDVAAHSHIAHPAHHASTSTYSARPGPAVPVTPAKRKADTDILFDNDGLPGVEAAWRQFAKEYDFDGQHAIDATHGQRLIDSMRKYCRIEDHEKLLAEVRRFEEAVIAGGPEPLPGVPALMEQVRKNAPTDRHGWAIVTSGTHTTRWYALNTLERIGLGVPEEIVTSEDVTHGKPHPEPYIAGAKKCSVAEENFSRVLVVEDAESGVASGRAAGMKVLALCTTTPREALVTLDPDWIVPDLS